MIFLKFPDEATFLAKAEEAGLTYTDDEENSHVSTGSHEYSLDIVGVIYNDDGVYETDPETADLTVISEPTTVDGYHINMVGDVPESFDEYIIDPPNTPARIFAGYKPSTASTPVEEID